MTANDRPPQRGLQRLRERRNWSMARLHQYNRMTGMSITRDVLETLGWKRGDEVIYAVRGDKLWVQKFQPPREQGGE